MMGISDVPILGPAHDLLYGKAKTAHPAAHDPDHPNNRGIDTRQILRLVDAKTKEEVQSVQLPLRAKATQRTADVRMAIHGTAGGYHVDRPKHSAHGLVHYVLTGHTGMWPSGKKDGAYDGMAAVWRIKEILDNFAAGDVFGFPADQFDLWFFDLNAPLSADDGAGDTVYSVVPERSLVDLGQTGQTGTLYNYTLRLACIDRPDALSFLPVELNQKKERSLLAKVMDAIGLLNDFSFDNLFAKYKELISPFLRVKAAIGDVRNFLQGWARGARAFIGYNIALFESTVSDLTGLMNVIKGTDVAAPRLRSPQDRFGPDGHTLRQLQAVKLALTRIRDSMGASPGVLSGRLRQSGGTLGQRAGLAGQQTPMQGINALRRLSPSDQRDRRPAAGQSSERIGSMLVKVAEGQTLDSLVPSGFTDLDVLRMNPDLAYPYVDGNRQRADGEDPPAPGTFYVAYQGDTIRIPSRAGQPQATARGGDPGASNALRPGESDDERIFGRDLYVNPETRALELDPSTSDVRTIAGVPNLLQRLRHIIVIPVGTLRISPESGSYLLAESRGRWGGGTQVRLNAVAAQRTIRQDPGIAAVRKIRVSQYDGRLKVEFEAETVAGSALGKQALAV